jgi:hypothetical protein
MSQINVNVVDPQSGTVVNVNGVATKAVGANGRLILYGGSEFTPNTSTGNGVTIIGGGAMIANTGNNNTAVGNNTLRSNTSGIQNTALGVDALFTNETGDANTAIGMGALYSTTADNNTAVGKDALYQSSTGTENVCVGAAAGFTITTGSYNVVVGTSSGATLTTGSNNICLGDDTQVATATTSNSITLGNTTHNILRCAVTSITSLSDARDKKNIEELSAGLDFVKGLKPVEFVWNERNTVSGKKDIKDFGFIAQDLKKSQEDAKLADTLKLVYEENPEKLEATYGKLIPILVKAIQDLSAKVETLEAEKK